MSGVTGNGTIDWGRAISFDGRLPTDISSDSIPNDPNSVGILAAQSVIRDVVVVEEDRKIEIEASNNGIEQLKKRALPYMRFSVIPYVIGNNILGVFHKILVLGLGEFLGGVKDFFINSGKREESPSRMMHGIGNIGVGLLEGIPIVRRIFWCFRVYHSREKKSDGSLESFWEARDRLIIDPYQTRSLYFWSKAFPKPYKSPKELYNDRSNPRGFGWKKFEDQKNRSWSPGDGILRLILGYVPCKPDEESITKREGIRTENTLLKQYGFGGILGDRDAAPNSEGAERPLVDEIRSSPKSSDSGRRISWDFE